VTYSEGSTGFRSAGTAADLIIGDADPGTDGRRTAVHYLGTGDSTDGRFGLYRWEMNALAGSGRSTHYHKTISESFFVLNGTIRLYDGNEWVAATAGDYLYVAPGGEHGFSNESGAAASMLVLFAPGNPREKYFEELADIVATGRELSRAERVELYARHDQYMVQW
jgi:mannose-6-phosphate isomerase-like protein (cupin superfamily)